MGAGEAGEAGEVGTINISIAGNWWRLQPRNNTQPPSCPPSGPLVYIVERKMNNDMDKVGMHFLSTTCTRKK